MLLAVCWRRAVTAVSTCSRGTATVIFLSSPWVVSTETCMLYLFNHGAISPWWCCFDKNNYDLFLGSRVANMEYRACRYWLNLNKFNGLTEIEDSRRSRFSHIAMAHSIIPPIRFCVWQQRRFHHGLIESSPGNSTPLKNLSNPENFSGELRRMAAWNLSRAGRRRFSLV